MTPTKECPSASPVPMTGVETIEEEDSPIPSLIETPPNDFPEPMDVQSKSTDEATANAVPESERPPAPQSPEADAVLGVQQLRIEEENSVPGAGASSWYEVTVAEEREEAARAAEAALAAEAAGTAEAALAAEAARVAKAALAAEAARATEAEMAATVAEAAQVVLPAQADEAASTSQADPPGLATKTTRATAQLVPPPPNFSFAWYNPHLIEVASAVALRPTSDDPLRRPVRFEDQGREKNVQPADQVDVSRGAIRKTRASTEERESLDAERELENYLEGGRDNRQQRTGRFLPIDSGARFPDDENWDDDRSVNAAPLISARPKTAETSKRRPSKGRASRYNERRHLEPEDIESVVVVNRTRSPSPMLVRELRPTSHQSRRQQVDRPDAAPRRPAAELPMRLSGVRFGGLTPIPTDTRVDPPPYHCYNCWQRGHDVLQCPRPHVMIYCFNCGRRGVNMTTCPRCKDAHRRSLEGPPREDAHRSRAERRHESRAQRQDPYPRVSPPAARARQEPEARVPPPAAYQGPPPAFYQGPSAVHAMQPPQPGYASPAAVPGNVRDRLGPPVMPQDVLGNDRVRAGLEVLHGLQQISAEVKEAMLRWMYVHRGPY